MFSLLPFGLVKIRKSFVQDILSYNQEFKHLKKQITEIQTVLARQSRYWRRTLDYTMIVTHSQWSFTAKISLVYENFVIHFLHQDHQTYIVLGHKWVRIFLLEL